MTRATLRATGALIAIFALGACSGEQGGDPMKQYGPNPLLPEPHQYLLPPMSVPNAVGWKPGETPTVPAGMRIQAATRRPCSRSWAGL